MHSAVSGHLANSLLESTAPAEEAPFRTPRFNYYTDPMAAFTANKRSGSRTQAAQEYFRPPNNNSSPAAHFSSPTKGSWTHNMPPSPGQQMQNYHSPNSSMTPSAAHQMQNYHSACPGMHRAWGPYYNAGSQGSPGSTSFPMHQIPPHARAESGRLEYIYAFQRGPYPVHEGHPGFQPKGSSSRKNWLGNSPNRGRGNHPGRGQGHWRGGRNQFSGQSGLRGRGWGSHFYGTAAGEGSWVESFYDKSMFEDPWKNLESAVWKA